MWLILVLSTLLLLIVAWAPRFGLAARWRNTREWRLRALVEDALKYVHAAELRGTPATPESLAGHLRLPLGSILRVLAETEARGLTQTAGAGLTLTPTGREVAVRVIRAHRLLERYFADELRLPLTALHAAADAREHALTAEEASVLDGPLLLMHERLTQPAIAVGNDCTTVSPAFDSVEEVRMNDKVSIWIDHRTAVIVSASADHVTVRTLESQVGSHSRNQAVQDPRRQRAARTREARRNTGTLPPASSPVLR